MINKKSPLFKVNLDGLDNKPRWYIIVTNYNYEQKVAKDINKIAGTNKSVLEAFSGIKEIVTYRINKKNEKIKKIKNEKIFPNYVFAKMVMNITTWNMITNITGVSAILCSSGYPVPVQENKIVSIKSKLI